MNVCTFIGRVGRDAEQKSTSGGDAYARWSIATESGFGDKKKTTWCDCTLWGARAEKIAQYIRKGDRIGVSGEVSLHEHDGKTYMQLRVSEVELLGDKRDGAPASAPKPSSRTARQEPVDEDEIPF